MKILGIYQIINKVNNKSYIGSSSDINKRFRTHKRDLNKNNHHNIHLQRAWNKYNESGFIFSIIEECSKDSLLKREQYYLDNLKPEYNISLDSAAPMTNRKHSLETIEKFKNRKSLIGPEHRLYGTKWSEELRETILKSRKGYKHSEATKEKMSNTSKKLNRANDLKEAIEGFKKEIIDNLGNIFDSLTKTAEYHKISVQTVCDILKGRHSKTRKGISFKYNV